MGEKRQWVVGFLFDDGAERVILIRKNRPEWQAGKLNGVGGKIDGDESIQQAITREFREEAGVHITDWHHFASLTWEEGIVHFLRSFAVQVVLDACWTVTDERIEQHRVCTLSEPGPGRDCVTPNLLWLVPLAAHRHDTYDLIDVAETGTTMRKPGRLDVLAGSPAAPPEPTQGEQ